MTALLDAIGYAGWAPGQLDRELEIGSWHVLPASADIVFAEDPGPIWDRLALKPDIRTDTGPGPSRHGQENPPIICSRPACPS